MYKFWSVWKFIGLGILGTQVAILLSLFFVPVEWMVPLLIADGVLWFCLLPLAAIDIHQSSR